MTPVKNVYRIILFIVLLFLAACKKQETATPTVGITPMAVVTRQVGYPYPGVEELPLEQVELPNATPYPMAEETDPHIEIDLSQTLYKVGDIITLVGQVVDIGLPYYTVIVRDEGVQDAPPVAEVTYENQVTLMENSSKVLELQSASATMNQITLTFLAKSAGKTTVTIQAIGEVHQGSGGAAMWQGGSGEVVIVVEAQ